MEHYLTLEDPLYGWLKIVRETEPWATISTSTTVSEG
jgi:hypothetical protein